MTFTAGYGNVFGDYWQHSEKGWLARIPGQADLIETICADDGLFFVATELHAEHNAHFPLMEALGDVWRVAPGNGGNLLLHKRQLEVLSTQNLMMPGNRWFTKWNVRHAASGVKWWVVGAHLIAGSEKGDQRVAQAQYIVTKTATLHRAIMGADLNSSSQNVGYPHQILADGRWVSVRHTSERPVTNTNLASHENGEPGQWIEGLYTKDLVRTNSAGGVPTNGLSDHSLWFQGNFTIQS